MVFWDQTLTELFTKGSFVMWPLLGCSIVGAAIIVERMIYFLWIRLNYHQFMQRLLRVLREPQGIKNAVHLCRRHANPIPRVIEKYLSHLKRDDLRDDILKREGTFALEKLEARLKTLAAITHLAPLLGLLGTVTGLVTAFHQIELVGGQVQAAELAGGIWEALITTVFGLLIAIPCMAAYHGYEAYVDKIARRMQLVVLELDEFFGKQSVGAIGHADTVSENQTMNAVHE